MNDQDFVKSVLRTEAPVTPELVSRFHGADAVKEIVNVFGAAVELGGEADKLKKYLFYGKQYDLQFDPNSSIAPSIKASLDESLIRIIHGALGMFTESCEMLSAIVDHIVDEKELDKVNLVEEMGDSLWYQGILSDELKTGLDEVKTKVIAKLRSRYPEKFTEADALVRDLEAERKVLEA